MSKYTYYVEHEGAVGTIVADTLADAREEAISLAQDGDYPDDGCTLSARLVNHDDTEASSDWFAITVAPMYFVATDAFKWNGRCDCLDNAIEQAFDGEIRGIVDEETLYAKFQRYVADGGWCWIECQGERVVEINR